MSTQNAQEIKQRILLFLENRGPSLPVQIAKAAQQNTIFTGAFLSELLAERKIKTSNMKVGGSFLYLIPGQENKLENFEQFLKGKEKEAFLLLKEKKTLNSKEQLPPIRVALQELKDFAIPFVSEGQQYWRYISHSEQEALQQFQQKAVVPEIVTTQSFQQPTSIIQEEQEQKIAEVSIPKLQKKEIIKTKRKEKEAVIKETSAFVHHIKETLEKEQMKIINEQGMKKKEWCGVCSIASQLGELHFFVVAKDKKKITSDDIIQSIQQSKQQKMPVILITPAILDKKAEELWKEHQHIVKIKKIK